MSFFRRRPRSPRTRAEIVADADRARARGSLKKAVAGYREALEADPLDPAVNTKLGMLLATLGDAEGGARCLRRAAERHLQGGFIDRAGAVCVAASGLFPLDVGFRLEVARLNVLRGRKADAVAALLAGGRALANARRRPAAVSLLRRALEIEPRHLDTSLRLAAVLAADGHRVEASALLDDLERHVPGGVRARVRRAAFRVAPSPRRLWRWVAAAFTKER